MEIGDIETDPDGSEWIVISVVGRGRVGRVRRNSLAHQKFAERSPKFAESLGDDESTGISETAPGESAQTP